MPRKNKNFVLKGEKYGRWIAISDSFSRDGSHYCECMCECGTIREVAKRSLIKKLSTSCGCFKRENTSNVNKTHGMSNQRLHSEYRIWNLMIQRCENPNIKCYIRYGGRGIKVCERWRSSFESFYEDVGPRPSPYHSLDRWPNNNGDYEPGNFRWATLKEQLRNFRGNTWLEYGGKKMILKDWSDYFEVTPGAIIGHMKRGKTFEEVVLFYNNKRNATISNK